MAGEAGLLMCTFPRRDWDFDRAKGTHEGFAGYFNECMNGFEYQVAGHMVWEDMVTEALAICHGIQQRYHPAKHNPFNEIECGDHYARAMASWGVFTALAGFEYHGPQGHIGFTPHITPENFRAAFTAAEGWGSFAQTRTADVQRELIDLRWGQLKLTSLAFSVPRNWKEVEGRVLLTGAALNSHAALRDGRLEIELGQELKLSNHDALEIEIRPKSGP
jgi:hypothetical protein